MTFAGGDGRSVGKNDVYESRGTQRKPNSTPTGELPAGATPEPQPIDMTPPDRGIASHEQSETAVPVTRPAVPAPARRGTSPGDWGLLSLRVFAGLALALAHGTGKIPPSAGFVEGVAGMGFPAPLVFAWAAGLAESAGGLLLALGFFTRPAAFFVLVNMLVASFLMQAGDPFLERELALLYSFVAFFYLLAGPGRLSLDRLRATRSSDRGAPRSS